MALSMFVRLRFARQLFKISRWLLQAGERILEKEVARLPESSDTFRKLLGE